MVLKHIWFIVILFLVLFSIKTAHAESTVISQSDVMDKVIFDGKWTYYYEWKRSSLTDISYNDDTKIELRTAHQDNFIYVFIDVITKTTFEKGSDTAMICFDKQNEKLSVANEDDYCFLSVLGSNNSFVLQGGSPLGMNNNFKKISTTNQFIGIGNISDQNDRYTVISHPSYEFRIPTELVGRSDQYGFYVGVYDSHSNKMYSWPQDIVIDSPLKIPSPSKWGELVSPDKSIPEFPWPAFTLVSSLLGALYFTRKFRIINRS